MDPETARVVTRLLELVLRGELEPAEALAQWPRTTDAEPVLGDIWHDLWHFAADDDIRQKDKEYADYQIGLLRKGMTEIKKTYGLK